MGNPIQTLTKLLRQRSPTETPEEHFGELLQRELTPDEKHMLGLADIALQDNLSFRKNGPTRIK